MLLSSGQKWKQCENNQYLSPCTMSLEVTKGQWESFCRPCVLISVVRYPRNCSLPSLSWSAHQCMQRIVYSQFPTPFACSSTDIWHLCHLHHAGILQSRLQCPFGHSSITQWQGYGTLYYWSFTQKKCILNPSQSNLQIWTDSLLIID